MSPSAHSSAPASPRGRRGTFGSSLSPAVSILLPHQEASARVHRGPFSPSCHREAISPLEAPAQQPRPRTFPGERRTRTSWPYRSSRPGSRAFSTRDHLSPHPPHDRYVTHPRPSRNLPDLMPVSKPITLGLCPHVHTTPLLCVRGRRQALVRGVHLVAARGIEEELRGRLWAEGLVHRVSEADRDPAPLRNSPCSGIMRPLLRARRRGRESLGSGRLP